MENQHAISSRAQYLLLNMPFILRGRMIPSEFERLVNRDRADGKTPFFVNATAGTTVTGSYDPINAVADVAEKHGMWLHVDVSTVRAKSVHMLFHRRASSWDDRTVSEC